MQRSAKILGLTILWLGVLDVMVALVLSAPIGPLKPLDRYFEFGRSVPGKITQWQAEPEQEGNLFDVGWISRTIQDSAQKFAAEPGNEGPVVRSYGMSFVNDILAATQQISPEMKVDVHAGPGVPPNWTYATFLDDRANRRAGDVVVLGILSSAIPAMEALSNRSWVFEQPAPLTYPIFHPNGSGGLDRLDPLVRDPDTQRALAGDPALRAAWDRQLARNDALYRPAAFVGVRADISPFIRLVRRAAASAAIEDAKARVLREDVYWGETLRRMVGDFARVARADGQRPVVVLIQTKGPEAPDLRTVLAPVLEAQQIPYLATADHADPADPSVFVADGHYTAPTNRRFAARFLELID